MLACRNEFQERLHWLLNNLLEVFLIKFKVYVGDLIFISNKYPIGL